jgi:F-type H+-transporting ATPase subunit epsilon
MDLEIVTPERRVAKLSGVDEVRAPGAQGGFGIRAGHAGREEHWAVAGGFLQVDEDRVIVLADSAESREEIDVEAARREHAEGTERLRTLGESDPTYPVEAARVRRATARLTVAGK